MTLLWVQSLGILHVQILLIIKNEVYQPVFTRKHYLWLVENAEAQYVQ